jgi:colicin import membrane protein
MDRVVLEGRELVPLRIGFDVVLRGYRRDQVKRFVRESEAETRLLTADRDAAVARAEELAQQLEEQRSDNDRLRERLDLVCRTPIDADALTERLKRMLELARDEAAEITERARAAAEDTWASAEQAGARLRERYERMIAELDVRRQEMETEHRELIERTRAEVEEMTSVAEQRRHHLDEQAEHRRQQVESDFEIAMAARRAEVMRQLAERRAKAEAEAKRLIDTADEHARDTRAEARREVNALREVRDGIIDLLGDTGRLLAEALPLLRPIPGEPDRSEPVVPAQSTAEPVPPASRVGRADDRVKPG